MKNIDKKSGDLLKHKFLLIILLFSIMFIITGCWNSRELNTLAISICTGIDKTEKGYKITQQILNPKAIASKKSTSESPVILFTEEGEDLFEILRKITTKNPRKIYLSHLKLVVISTEVAKDGIEDIVDFFARDHECRTDFYFLVAKNASANKVLSVITPLESVPGIQMYDSIKISEKSWAPTKRVKIVELINSIISQGISPVINGVEILGDNTSVDSIDKLRHSSVSSSININWLGAFNKDKLVGWLNEDESKGYNYITDNVKSTVEYLHYGEDTKITLEIMNSKSKIKVDLVDNKPSINVEINISQNIGTVSGPFDITDTENIILINEMIEKKIIKYCNKSIDKVKEDLQTDILGFGDAIHRKYPKLWSEIKDDWNKQFINTPVHVNVHVKTNKTGQITKSYFIKDKD